ncbi:hypothetical protein [Burkholderia pseudomallei]|uniref:hypothetical protein n=1 Tax=Burkholderia pseudomallei TaxID=28450 RepID=UPI0012F4930F|nr:hypothetical protein [Burkholderia pseudomallei]
MNIYLHCVVQGIFYLYAGFINMEESMDGMEDRQPPLSMQPPDANGCGNLPCPTCEVLKDQLFKLSCCLAVAQRLTIIEVG